MTDWRAFWLSLPTRLHFFKAKYPLLPLDLATKLTNLPDFLLKTTSITKKTFLFAISVKL
jgi:hypothetical protein